MLSSSAITTILKERGLTSTSNMANFSEMLMGDGGISYKRTYTGGYRYIAYDEYGNMDNSATMQYRTENLLDVKNRCIYITTSGALSSYTAEAQLIINNHFDETTTTTEDTGTISPTGNTGWNLWEYVDWGLDGLALGAEYFKLYPPAKYALWIHSIYKWLKKGLSNIAETYGEQTKTYSNDIYGLWYQYPSDTLDPIPTIRAKKIDCDYSSDFIYNSAADALEGVNVPDEYREFEQTHPGGYYIIRGHIWKWDISNFLIDTYTVTTEPTNP